VGSLPACSGGECVCAEGSCGQGKHCEGGKCALCNIAEACGPQCVSCVTPQPFCLDGKACAECLDDSVCAPEDHCQAGECVPDCYVPSGCAGDSGPSGEKCGEAKVIGRKEAASGYAFKGDTWDDWNNDDLGSWDTDCWDANSDNFFRIYLLAGEKLTVTLTPLEWAFDSMLKLYQGTKCDADEDLLLGCFDQGWDGEPDTIDAYSAQADGWHTIVVDGRSAFDEDGDFGEYTLSVKLVCSQPDCCCE
jgi:hypothetical protein